MPNVPVPGDMEGFGVVMLEAGLCGLPTVAADIEGIADVIEDGKNGRLVRSGDAEGFSEAILAYRREPEMLEEAGRRTVSHVLEHFGWNAAAEKYLRVLEARSTPRRARMKAAAQLRRTRIDHSGSTAVFQPLQCRRQKENRCKQRCPDAHHGQLADRAQTRVKTQQQS